MILVPVESDLQEIVKEISIMKQCDSPYIVRYFGSYFKDADLWVKEIHQKSILFIYFFKDCYGILWSWFCVRYNETSRKNSK